MKSCAVVLLIFLMIMFVGCSTTPTPNAPSGSTPSAAVREVETLSGADPLPSWNDGNAIAFVKTTPDKTNPNFVAPEDRIATFRPGRDVMGRAPDVLSLQFMIDRVRDLSAQHPEWSSRPPFKDS